MLKLKIDRIQGFSIAIIVSGLLMLVFCTASFFPLMIWLRPAFVVGHLPLLALMLLAILRIVGGVLLKLKRKTGFWMYVVAEAASLLVLTINFVKMQDDLSHVSVRHFDRLDVVAYVWTHNGVFFLSWLGALLAIGLLWPRRWQLSA